MRVPGLDADDTTHDLRGLRDEGPGVATWIRAGFPPEGFRVDSDPERVSAGRRLMFVARPRGRVHVSPFLCVPEVRGTASTLGDTGTPPTARRVLGGKPRPRDPEMPGVPPGRPREGHRVPTWLGGGVLGVTFCACSTCPGGRNGDRAVCVS